MPISSIKDDRIAFLKQTPKEQARKRIIDTDSAAYALIGRRCVFCRTVIIRKDVTPPNMCYESQLGHAAHKDCIAYIAKKYPDKPISDLEGKIDRIKVELVKSEL